MLASATPGGQGREDPNMPEERQQLRARVTGTVQGVGYRFFAISAGRRLNLSGYARNLAAGSVEVVAEGPRDRLLELVGALRQGPPAAHVEGVSQQYVEATNEFVGFDIRY